MAVFSNGGLTSPDIYVGVLCILVILISTTLNSLVFVHVARKNNSLARSLYLTLSAADFLTVWILTANYSVHVLKEKEDECKNSVEPACNEEYYKRVSVAHFGQKIHGILGWTAVVAPSNITAVLAMSRYYQIKYPLRQPNIKLVMSGLFILTLILLPIVTGCAMLDTLVTENSIAIVLQTTSLAWNFRPRVLGTLVSGLTYFILSTGVTWVLQVGAVAASILTMYELVKSHLKPSSGGVKGRKTRSSLKIIVTNIGSVLILVAFTITAVDVRESVEDVTFKEAFTYFLVALVVPALTSMLNPVIYIIMTPKFSFMCKSTSSVRARAKVRVVAGNIDISPP